MNEKWCKTFRRIKKACLVYPKKYAHGFCFAVLCCGDTLTDFPISIRLTSLALWQSNDCPSASKATLMNTDKCFMWIHYERLHNHNKAKHNKTVCIFLEIYCKGHRSIGLWSSFDRYTEAVDFSFVTSLNLSLAAAIGHWIGPRAGNMLRVVLRHHRITTLKDYSTNWIFVSTGLFYKIFHELIRFPRDFCSCLFQYLLYLSRLYPA